MQLVDLLDELLAASDVVSLHARLTAETKQMFDATAFAAMRPGSVLVNTARGELVDTRALDAALASGHLRGAVLRCVRPRATRTRRPAAEAARGVRHPHLAGASRQVAEESAARIAKEVATVLAGGAPTNCANPEVLQRESG